MLRKDLKFISWDMFTVVSIHDCIETRPRPEQSYWTDTMLARARDEIMHGENHPERL